MGFSKEAKQQYVEHWNTFTQTQRLGQCFRFHLSTAIVMMLSIGVALLLFRSIIQEEGYDLTSLEFKHVFFGFVFVFFSASGALVHWEFRNYLREHATLSARPFRGASVNAGSEAVVLPEPRDPNKIDPAQGSQ